MSLPADDYRVAQRGRVADLGGCTCVDCSWVPCSPCSPFQQWAPGQNPPCPPPAAQLGFTQPLTDYPHNPANGGEYVTGGAFVPNGAWGSAYDGGYLFADGNQGKIFFRSAAGNTNYNTPFVTGIGGVSDIGFVMEPAGWALYYASPLTPPGWPHCRWSATATPRLRGRRVAPCR